MDIYYKDPDARKPYSVDWSALLKTDTIATSVWLPVQGLTLEDDSVSGQTASVWISGGADGTGYSVTNRITSAAGIIDDHTFKVFIMEQ